MHVLRCRVHPNLGVPAGDSWVVNPEVRLGAATDDAALDVIAEQRRYLEIESGFTAVLRDGYDAEVEIERATGLAVMRGTP